MKKKQSKAAQVEDLLVRLVNACRAHDAGMGSAMLDEVDEVEAAMEDLSITRHVLCPTCKGDGETRIGENHYDCDTCEGAGNILPEDLAGV
jgi:RecJ-like exonuclease